MTKENSSADNQEASLAPQAVEDKPPAPHGQARRAMKPAVTAQQSASCPTCAGGAEGENGSYSYVYCLGRIRPQFPNLSVEKEFAQATGRTDTAGLTDAKVLHKFLTDHEYRYLARQMCWVFSVEGHECYLVQPADPTMLDTLCHCVRENPTDEDIDVLVGVKGPLAPPEMCNGLVLPIVAADQVWSFNRKMLLDALQYPGEKKPTEEQKKQFKESAGDILEKVADNPGDNDEQRAVNYLVVRSQEVYSLAWENLQQGRSLTGIETTPSRLSGSRNLVGVVFTFTDRKTGVVSQYYVRVDVTEEFPFLVSKPAPTFERP